jgi:hypothetical protein
MAWIRDFKLNPVTPINHKTKGLQEVERVK